MEVLLLGTGAADGWPSPFCGCRSCTAMREERRTRLPSAALLDGRILVDAGPTVPGAAARLGRSLRDVHHVLVTHAHHDHLDPALLLALDWNPPPQTVHLWGPAQAIAACRPWVGPRTRVHLHEVGAGDVLRLPTPEGDWIARTLAATHDPATFGGPHDALAAEALLYDIADPAGSRLLYATDTGPLSPHTVAAVAQAHFDVVVLEETFGAHGDHRTGHLDLSTFPEQLARLRDAGAIHDATEVAATHLGHHNPPEAELREILAGWGVRLPDDGATLGRANRTLVMGGARSGKSAHAEHLARDHVDVVYVATAGPRPGDAEWAARVATHRSRRPARWRTREGHREAAPALREATRGEAVLVDCLTLWLTGVLDDASGGDWEAVGAAALRAAADAATKDLVDAVSSSRGNVILVSNEVGQGIVPATAAGRWFIDLHGRLNQEVARACDDVILMTAGVAQRIGAGR